MMPNAPTKEELFYAELAGKAVGDIELWGKAIVEVNAQLETGRCDLNQFVEAIKRMSGYMLQRAKDYSSRADEFSKAAFLERYENSGESPAAPKSQAN